MKEHILNITFAEPPQETNSLLNNDEITYIELEQLFQSDDEEDIFEGFETSLNTIFQTDDEDAVFEGFQTSLNTLFLSDVENENEDFQGF